MSGRVVALRPKERVCQDSGPIALIYRNMGTAAAEAAVNRALGDVAALVAVLAERVRQRNLADLDRRLLRMQRMADELGMVSLAAVSAQCAHCLAAGDGTAFAAVWARLLRVAECTLEPDKGRADLMR
jgi:hypothetical protein